MAVKNLVRRSHCLVVVRWEQFCRAPSKLLPVPEVNRFSMLGQKMLPDLICPEMLASELEAEATSSTWFFKFIMPVLTRSQKLATGERIFVPRSPNVSPYVNM